MLEKTSTEIKTLILLRLTKKIIENTNTAGMLKLENLVYNKKTEKIKIPKQKTKEEIEKEKKEKIKKEVKEKLEYTPSEKITEGIFTTTPIQRKKEITIPIPPKPKQIPQPRQFTRQMPTRMQQSLQQIARQEPRLPEHLQGLRPEFSQEPLNIDLGELTPLLNDPNVKIIETEGADKRVTVSGAMGKKPTGITLTGEQIDEIIDKFSKEAKIPKTEGLFKVTLKNTILTAMISPTLGNRFILKKIM
jgi:hypothetical protein